MFSTLLLTRPLQMAGLMLIRAWTAFVLVSLLSLPVYAQDSGNVPPGSSAESLDSDAIDPAFGGLPAVSKKVRESAEPSGASSAPVTADAGSAIPASVKSDAAGPVPNPESGTLPGGEKSPAEGVGSKVPPSESDVREADQRARRGMKAIQQKDWAVAIEELESALKLTPDNGSYHHALGVAYMGQQQPNAGWFHFRQAVRLDPAYVPAAVDFMKTWKLLDAQAVFNVGTPLTAVVQTLGRPDQADDLGPRLRLIYGFMSLNFLDRQLFSILDLRNLPPEGLHAVDGLAFTLPQDEWKVAYRMLSATQGNTEYVPAGQTLQSWTELFASQRFINTAQTTAPRELMQGIQQRLAGNFPDLKFEVLRESPTDVLFAWSIPETPAHPAQQELVRLVQGKQDVHRLAFTRKGSSLAADERSRWQSLLDEAELMPAEKLRAFLLQEQEQQQEAQLREISVQILEKQFELIRQGNAEELKVYFVPAQRALVTPELLQKVTARLDALKPEELVAQVDLTEHAEGIKARLINNRGQVFTTLIQTDGRWFAEDVWMETILK